MSVTEIPTSEGKTCRVCQRWLALSDYHKSGKTPDGYRHRCRECSVPGSPADRFWPKVDRRGPSDCWPWLGRTFRGYGKFEYEGGQLAHRFAYEQEVGPIPVGLVVDHTCHTADATCRLGTDCPHRRCVNPAHLRCVTATENSREARHPKTFQLKAACRKGHPFVEGSYRLESGGRRRRCLICSAAYFRAYNAAGRRVVSREHVKAKNLANRARRKGLLVPQPCEVCGSQKVQAHHDDYDRPLVVRWLCPKHHRQADIERRARERASA